MFLFVIANYSALVLVLVLEQPHKSVSLSQGRVISSRRLQREMIFGGRDMGGVIAVSSQQAAVINWQLSRGGRS